MVLLRLVTMLALLICSPLFAQTTDADDEDETFDQALRSFGYTAGAAWQCSAEEARASLLDEVNRAYSGLVRLFGTDRAFFFAAAFGAGTVDAIEETRCQQFITEFEEGMQSATEPEQEAP